MNLYRKTYAEVDLDSLEKNWNFILKNFPDHFICPMVKANAYGHGDIIIAKALEKFGVKTLGVCLIEEGLVLREFGIKSEILVFRGFDLEGAEAMKHYQLTPVVSSWEQLRALEKIPKAWDYHLKFDTGMNRLGFSPTEAQKVFEFVKEQKKWILKGVLTHLVSGEDDGQSGGMTEKQVLDFQKVVEVFQFLKPQFHVLNSGGMLSKISLTRKGVVDHPLMSHNWGLRPGLSLYGYNPGVTEDFFELDPVMTLKSHISVLRSVKKNEGVSYNHTWKAQRPSMIAVVPMGYADGYHRRLSNKGQALYRGRHVPIIGSVCMDYLMLDMTDIREITPSDIGSEVILFGKDNEENILSVHDLAIQAQTIPWEILTSLSERVPRLYKGRWAKTLQEGL